MAPIQNKRFIPKDISEKISRLGSTEGIEGLNKMLKKMESKQYPNSNELNEILSKCNLGQREFILSRLTTSISENLGFFDEGGKLNIDRIEDLPENLEKLDTDRLPSMFKRRIGETKEYQLVFILPYNKRKRPRDLDVITYTPLGETISNPIILSDPIKEYLKNSPGNQKDLLSEDFKFLNDKEYLDFLNEVWSDASRVKRGSHEESELKKRISEIEDKIKSKYGVNTDNIKKNFEIINKLVDNLITKNSAITVFDKNRPVPKGLYVLTKASKLYDEKKDDTPIEHTKSKELEKLLIEGKINGNTFITYFEIIEEITYEDYLNKKYVNKETEEDRKKRIEILKRILIDYKRIRELIYEKERKIIEEAIRQKEHVILDAKTDAKTDDETEIPEPMKERVEEIKKELLNIDDLEELKKRFNELIKIYHPDIASGPDKETFKEITIELILIYNNRKSELKSESSESPFKGEVFKLENKLSN